MDYSPPGSLVHGIFQARILEWVAISSSREGIFPTQESNLHLLHWQAGSVPLTHLGSSGKYYSAIKDLTLIQSITWRDLENFKLSEITQTQKDGNSTFPLRGGVWNRQIYTDRK